MDSIWRKITHNPERLALSGHIQTEAAVIGGGMAGILTAFFLQEAGVKTIVLEAGHVGEGQTGSTTAKITAQHGLIYDGLIHSQGKEKAALYARANSRAVEDYRSLVQSRNIQCRWLDCPAYLYTRCKRDVVENEVRACNELGLPVTFVTDTQLPFPVAGAAKMEGQACFSPLEFLFNIAGELTVYENTEVKRVEGKVITTAGGDVTAEHIVFAGHFPFINRPGYYFARMHQDRSYCLALSGAGHMEGMYYGMDEGDYSFRGLRLEDKDLVILGGCNHRTGANEGGRYERLRNSARSYWPDCKEEAAWSAQDCMTLDAVPYIGRFSPAAPGWYVATGFGKWGMSHSMVAARLLADLITGKENPAKEVFTPSRFGWDAAESLAKQAGCTIKGYVGKRNATGGEHLEDLRPGEGHLVEYGNGKIGAYRDESGTLHLVSARCPHLGCELTWNPDEKSWDCPCHGSRFDYEGKVLDGPAQENIGLRWE